MRVIIRGMIRLVLFPVILGLTILEWAGNCITNFAGKLCKAAAGVIFLLTLTAWLTGIASAEQIITPFIAGAVLCLIPLAAKSVIMCVVLANAALTDISKL